MTSIKVPPLGESIVEATISRWLKNEGDPVAPGDTLVELETDKITVEVPSVTGGVLKKRFANEGDVVKLDQLLAEIDEKADGTKREEGGGRREEVTAMASAAKPAPEAAVPSPAASASAPKEAPRASPAAQRVAAESGADLANAQGAGRGGVSSKADVVEAKPAAQQPAAQTPSAPPPSSLLPPPSGERETREKMSTRRKRIAEHLLEAQHATAH